MVKNNALRRSARDALANSKKLRRLHDRLWNSASSAPIFCRETGVDKNGRVLRRSARLIGGHAYQIAASGAAAALTRSMKHDLESFGSSYESDVKTTAVSIALSKGSKMVLEQVICAYVQEAILAATRMNESLGSRKRLNKSIVKAAFEQVNQSIFFASSPAPRATVVMALPKKRSKFEEEEDFVPDEAAGAADAVEAV
jgi:hypothetical protein